MPEEDRYLLAAQRLREEAAKEAYEEPQDVVLPDSRATFLIRRPRPMAYILEGFLPQSMAAKIQGEAAAYSEEEIIAWLRCKAAVLAKAIVRPRLSFLPGPDEIHPGWFSAVDRKFLDAYLRGEVDANGASLDTFPDERSRLAISGAGGGDVAHEAVSVGARSD